MTLVDSRTHTERLADQIADAILDGAFTPGARLDEVGLAERYGVSRTPVREALRQLTTSGLIVVRPRRGAVVATTSREQLNSLFVAMGEAEATCARLCALSMTPVERRTLGAMTERMAALVRRSDTRAYTEANIAFHAFIYGGAHNPIIEDFAMNLRRRLAPFRRAQFRAPGRLKRSQGEHERVVAAIVKGDAEAAHATMLEHVNLVETTYDQLIASTGKMKSR